MTAVMEVDPYRIDSKSVRLGVTVTQVVLVQRSISSVFGWRHIVVLHETMCRIFHMYNFNGLFANNWFANNWFAMVQRDGGVLFDLIYS